MGERHEIRRDGRRVQAGDVAPDDQPTWWQRCFTKPAGYERVMPPLDLHDVGGADSAVEFLGTRADQQFTAMACQMRAENIFFRLFKTGHDMSEAIAPARGLFDQS